MADISSPDRVGVNVWPDTRDFLRDLRATLKKVEKSVRVNVPIVVDGDRLQADTDAETKKVRPSPVQAQVKLEDGFLAKMQRDLRAATAALEAEVPLTPDGEQLRRQTRTYVMHLQAEMESMAVQVPLDAEADAAAKADLAKEVATLQALAGNIAVGMDVESAKAAAQLAVLSRDREVTLRPRVDEGSRRTAMAAFDSITSGLRRTIGQDSAFASRRGGMLGIVLGIARGFTVLGTSLPFRAFDMLADSAEAAGDAFKIATTAAVDGGKGMSLFGGLARGAGAGLMSIVSSAASMGPAVAILLALLSAAIGGTAALVSLLTANFLVLAGTITKSIMGPLLALAPAAIAFGAGAVIAGGGIYYWAKKSEELEKAMAPIRGQLQLLGRQITPVMDKFAQLFGSAAVSMIRSFRGAVVDVLEDMYAKMTDSRMDRFYDRWNVQMPRIFESLGKAISSFGAGLVAFFAPVLPYSQRLVDAIQRGADRFLEWSTSARGQNAIAGWMREAWDISRDLWSGLKDIGAAILDVMGIGVDESGGDFAQWVRDIGRDFRKWVESEGGRERIKQWFKDAEELARDVKDIIVLIAKAFDTLDSPEGRAMLGAFMEFLKVTATTGWLVAEAIQGINTVILGFFERVGGAGRDFIDFWTSLFTGDLSGAVDAGLSALQRSLLMLTPWESFSEMGEAIPDAIQGWFDIDWTGIWQGITDGIASGFERLLGWIWQQASGLGDSLIGGFRQALGIASPSQRMIELMGQVGMGILIGLLRIPAMLLSAAMQIGWSIVNGVIGGLVGLGGRILGAVSQVGGLLAGWASSVWGRVAPAFSAGVTRVVGFVTGLPGRVMGAVGGLAGRLGGWAMTAWNLVGPAFSAGVSRVVSFAMGLPGRVMGAVAGLAGRLGGWASTAWGVARTAFGAGVSRVVSFAMSLPGRVMGAVAGLAGRISGWASAVWGRARSMFSVGIAGAVGIARGLPGRVMGAVAGLAGRLGGWARSAWGAARSAFSVGVTTAVGIARGLPGRVGGAIAGLAGRVGGVVRSAWTSARGAFQGGVSSVVGIARSLPGRVVGALGSVGSLLHGVGRNMMRGLANGISSASSMISDMVTRTVRNAVAFAKKWLGISSPSKVFMEIGHQTGEGLAIGLQREAANVTAASRRMVSGMDAAPKAIASASHRIASAGEAGTRAVSGPDRINASVERALSGWQPIVHLGDRDFYGAMKRVTNNREGR